MRSRKITATLVFAAAVALGVGFASAHGVTSALSVTHMHSSVIKPAKLDPFTGKMTTNYHAGLDNITYYQLETDEGNSYCIFDPGGGGPGTDLLLDPCSSSADDYWTVGTWAAPGSWTGDYYIQNEGGTDQCIDDPGGDNNIQLPVETCAEVGGQSWNTQTLLGGNSYQWLNAIVDAEAITLDYGTVKSGAWIVSNPEDILEDSQIWDGGPTGLI